MLTHSQQVLNRAGQSSRRMNDLRQVHASIMLSEGVHPRAAQEQLGHASITLDAYSHVTTVIQSEAVQRVGEVLDAYRRLTWETHSTDHRTTILTRIDTHPGHVNTAPSMTQHRWSRRLDQHTISVCNSP